MSRLLTLLAMFIAFATGVKADEEYPAQRTFEWWSVFIDSGDCWISSFTKDSLGYVKKNIIVFVTFHDSNPTPQVSVLFKNEQNLHSAKVYLSIGDNKYTFVTNGEMSFPKAIDNMEIFKLMVSKSPLTLSLVYPWKNVGEFSVLYEGFNEAYTYSGNNCGFYKNFKLHMNPQRAFG